MRTYAVTTPILPTRTWTLPMYKEGIKKLSPAPGAVGIVTSEEVFETYFAGDPLFHLVAEHAPMEWETLERIAHNREILRKWFLSERKETFQWWIDSDIEITDPLGGLKLMEHIQDQNCLMFSNGYPGREREHNWYGIGCTMIHRDIVDLGRFYVGKALTDTGRTERISEDYLYFSAYDHTKQIILSRIKPGYEDVHRRGDVVEVLHHTSNQD